MGLPGFSKCCWFVFFLQSFSLPSGWCRACHRQGQLGDQDKYLTRSHSLLLFCL